MNNSIHLAFGVLFIPTAKFFCPAAVPRPRGSSSGGGQSGVNMMQVQMDLDFAQTGDPIPKSWLLLDTCSTSSVANNPDLVHGLRDCS